MEQTRGTVQTLDVGPRAENGPPQAWPRWTPTVRFEVLGPLEIHDGYGVRTPRAHKLRVLLAILLMQGGTVVPVDSLMHEMWGESPPRTALKALRVYVSQLRRVLSVLPADGLPPVLVTQGPGYRLEIGDGDLDLIEFERLCELGRWAREENRLAAAARHYREALSLWRGPALVDVRSTPLLESRARSLEEERISALEHRIDLDINLRRHAEVIAELRLLVVNHPLHERVHAQLMIALYLAGRKSDAFETYRGLRANLVEELGVEPSPKIQLLHQAILTADEDALARWDAWI